MAERKATQKRQQQHGRFDNGDISCFRQWRLRPTNPVHTTEQIIVFLKTVCSLFPLLLIVCPSGVIPVSCDYLKRVNGF